jgi:hypothetical protein
MEKKTRGMTNAKGIFFQLKEEKVNRIWKSYKRVYTTDKGSKITERGFTWLGSIQTHRNMFGRLRRVSFTISFGFLWVIAAVQILWLLLQLLGQGLWWLLKKIGQGIAWVGRKLWQGLKWLWLLIVAFVIWLIAKFKGRKKENKPEEKAEKQPRNLKWLWWTLGVLLLAILVCGLFRACDSKEQNTVEPIYYTEQDEVDNASLYDDCIYDACCVKGYLDGYQTKAKPLGKKRNLLMLGVSEVNGQWIKKDATIEKSAIYDEMVKYFADKKEIFLSSVHKKLTHQEMVALQLVYLRMGSAGFAGRLIDGSKSSVRSESELVKALNNEEIITKLFRLPGTKATAEDNKESLQYFWVLYQIYIGNLSVDDVYNFPMQSYLNIPLKDMYKEDYPIWDNAFIDSLKAGENESFAASDVMP